MSELKFRIVLVPEEILNRVKVEEIVLQIKAIIETCGYTDISINVSQTKNSEDYAVLTEFVCDVQLRTNFDELPKIKQYEEFYFKWKQSFRLSMCSYIEFFEDDCFLDSKQLFDSFPCKGISFGVLPHNGHFFKFTDLTFSDSWINICDDSRNLTVTYSDQYLFEITFSYDNIRNIFVSNETNFCSLYFDLSNPPLIFRIDENTTKRRRTNYLFSLCSESGDRLNVDVDSDVLGRANVFSLNFDDSETVRNIISSIHYHYRKKPVYYSNISPILKHKPCDPIINDMHFGCCYLTTAIVKRNYSAISQTSNLCNELKKLHIWSEQNPEHLEKALTSVLRAIDDGKILNIWHTIELQYKYFTENKDGVNIDYYILPPNCCLIRKITITPTRMLLWPGEPTFVNLFLRNFDPEYSICVSFREDNMTKLTTNVSNAYPEVLELCITNPLNNGICIGSRKYDFLAWSISQLQDHEVWMYAEDKGMKTAKYIRNWIGDFSCINCIPKYMASLSPCFSTTDDTTCIPLDTNFIQIEEDVRSGFDPMKGEPYIFSDGIGKISIPLASKIHSFLDHDKLCSAFQILYRGYQGVLVVDPSLRGEQIVFRKSMKKFHGNTKEKLEVVKTSKPSPVRLNRHLITLLDNFGISHKILLKLQEKSLNTLADMMYDDEKTVNFLQSSPFACFYKYEDTLQSGINLTTEPFFKSILHSLYKYHIDKIKRKAHIFLDPSTGRNMLGAVDETNRLNYGEVFVQYSNDISRGETTKDTTILRGDVLVTKSHCLHPGEIRKLKAVDIPALHHIVDCIVFPQKGACPLPNEIAGSNLHGDEFIVIWHHDLIFEVQNHEAAHYPSVKSDASHNISVSEMVNFLQDYIKNDIVDLVADIHLVHADKKRAFSDSCYSLARKFFIANNYAFNGHLEQLNEEEELLMDYPDFMEKDPLVTYRSNNALGKMYRSCMDLEKEEESTCIRYENIQCDPDLIHPGWERFRDGAITAMNKYIFLLKCILKIYGIEHEAEILSGAFIRLHCRFQDRKNTCEVEKLIIACVKRLHDCMHNEFLVEFLNVSSNTSDGKDLKILIMQKASAWYAVSYSDSNCKYLSFPWIVSTYLRNIKLINKPFVTSPLFPPLIMNLDNKIFEKFEPPEFKTSKFWKRYHYLCDPMKLRYAQKVVSVWGQKGEVIKKGYTVLKLCTLNDINNLIFFHVCEVLGYVINKSDFKGQPTKECSVGLLFLQCLKYFSAFRLHTVEEMRILLPFPLPEYNLLSKHAVATYHEFAIRGTLLFLNFDKSENEKLIEMKPIYKNSVAFSSLVTAKKLLKVKSRVHEINLWEVLNSNKIGICAKGTKHTIRDLKAILNETDECLKAFIDEAVSEIMTWETNVKKKKKADNSTESPQTKSLPNFLDASGNTKNIRMPAKGTRNRKWKMQYLSMIGESGTPSKRENEKSEKGCKKNKRRRRR